MADWRKVAGRVVTDSELSVGGVSVTVNKAGTDTAVTLKANKAGTEAQDNPFETNAKGIWSFFVDTETLVSCDFELDIVFSKSGLDFSAINEQHENVAVIGGTTGTGEGLTVHAAVACATTANITLSGEQTLDGILTSTDRVLVKDQTDATENGIYVSAAGAWARATDFDEDDEAANSFVFVEGGTTLGSTGWVCTNEPDAQEIDVDDITFAQYSSVGYITAGTGLAKTGNELAVDGVLEDLDTLGAAASDGQFIVATGVGAFAYESGATARASLVAAKSGVNADITSLTALAAQIAVQVNPFGVGAGETGEIRFLELAAGGTAYVGFKAPDALDGNVIWTLPETDSTGTQALVSNGSLALSWASITGVTAVGTPVDNQLAVWKTAGTIEGDPNLYWNATKLDITGDLYSDGANVLLDGSTSVRLVSANFIALRSPENRIGFDTDDYMQIALAETTGITVITHTGTTPTVTWTADSFSFVGDFGADGATVLLDGSASVRGVSAGFVSLEATDIRFGFSAAIYTKFAVADTTGNLTITHVGGSTDLVTWTAAGGFAFSGAFGVTGATTLTGALTVGVSDTGHDVKFWGATAGAYFLFDQANDCVVLQGGATKQMEFRFMEDTDNGTDYVALKAPATLAAPITFTLPVDIDAGKVLQTDAAGVLSWVALAGGGDVLADGSVPFDGAVSFGIDGTGIDATFFGATASYKTWWDADGDTNGAWYFGADTKGVMVSLFGDVTGCGVFWDPSTDTNGTLSIGASGGSKGVDLTCYGATNLSLMQWDQSLNCLKLDGATLFIKEQAEAQASVEAYGQIWVDTAAPNLLMFTDDADTDFWLNRTAGIANTNMVVVDDADAADNDYMKFTASGVEGREYAEVLADIFSVALPENTSIKLDPVLSADTKWSGVTEDGTAGTTNLVYGYCYYLAATGKWELAKADVAATSINKLGMCVVAAAADATGTLLLYGKIRADDEFPAFGVGAPVFLSAATAGILTSTAPTGTTDFVVRIVGEATTADCLLFCPDNAYVELV